MNVALEILKELHLELDSIKKALFHLQNSYTNCKSIGLKEEYNENELEKWEAFTSRYSRVSDIVTQKIVSTIMLIETGSRGSLIDKTNFVEKNNLVEDGEDFRKLRLLRNYIAHEYTKQSTNEIFELVLTNYGSLNSFAVKLVDYCTNNPYYKI